MAKKATTPAVPASAPVTKSAMIALARQNLTAAREMLLAANSGPAPDPAEIAAAQSLLVDALAAYRVLVPKDATAPTPAGVPPVLSPEARADAVAAGLARLQATEGRKPVDDPTRLSGTEMRRRAKASAVPTVAPAAQKAALVQAREATVGAYLEPAMQALLADQTLRGEALRWTRQLIAWLTEADGHCSSAQPVLARKFVLLVKSELQAQETALREADVAPAAAPKAAKQGRVTAETPAVKCAGCGQVISAGTERAAMAIGGGRAVPVHDVMACRDLATFVLQVSR